MTPDIVGAHPQDAGIDGYVATATTRNRVLVVDDSRITRAGLCELVDRSVGSRSGGVAGDAREAIEAMRRRGPDVALVNVRPLTADELVTLSRAAPSGTALVVLRAPDCTLAVDDVLDAGVAGLVDLDILDDRLDVILMLADAGHSFCLLSDKHLVSGRRRGSQRRDPTNGATVLDDEVRLTARERQVLELVARGLSNRQVASDLRISEATVKKHVTHLLGKLNVQSRTQAALTLGRRPHCAAEPPPSPDRPVTTAWSSAHLAMTPTVTT